MSVYVQFGGFTDCPSGWRNFDSSIYLKASRFPFVGALIQRWLPFEFPGGVEIGDIVKGLPIEDSSVDVVFSSHVLEHLTYDEALIALKNVFRMLKPGGVLRLVVPDLESRVLFYLNNMRSLRLPASWLMRSTLLGRRAQRHRSLHSCFRVFFSSSDHQWMWDYASLKDALEVSGFSSVRHFKYGESGDPIILAAEKESRFFWSPGDWPGLSADLRDREYEEVAVEAIKPN